MTRWSDIKARNEAEIADATKWTWVPDRSWRPASREPFCRICGEDAIVERDRMVGGVRRGQKWYGSCAEHLRPYYRTTPSGRVECAVRVDSPAAKRGWVE